MFTTLLNFRKLFIPLITFHLSLITPSHAQNYRWAHGFGGSNANSHGTSNATDANANVYATGYFGDSIDFDPGPGITMLGVPQPTAGAIYVTKYDSAGLLLWAFSLQGYTGYEPHLTVNSTWLYLTGTFEGVVDFDPSPLTATLTANFGDIFLAKYDLNGNYIWAKNMGGNNVDVANSIAIDNVGNSYITGYFKGTADFDPGIGTANLISNGIQDVFFGKYDNLGNYIWAHSIGDTLFSAGQNIILNSVSDAIYISGYFNRSPDFDPGPSTSIVTSQNVDDFIAKYDTSGIFLWAGAISSAFTGGNLVADICVGSVISNEYLLVTGSFRNVTDFDLTSGVNNFSSSGVSQDLYIAKYDSSANLISLVSITAGTSIGPRGESLKVDSTASIFLTGTFLGTTDFDPGGSVSNLTSNGSSDIFFAKYDSLGGYLWAKGIGGTFTDQPTEIALDNKNNQYLTGFFTNNIDADPDMGSVILSPAQNENIFIGKYIEIPSGIFNHEINKTNNISLYPNPSESFVSFKEQFNQQQFNVVIVNSLGQTVFEDSTSSNTLNINSLEPGLYFLKIILNNKTYTAKFIKQ